jgi:hypothetical protein
VHEGMRTRMLVYRLLAPVATLVESSSGNLVS